MMTDRSEVCPRYDHPNSREDELGSKLPGQIGIRYISLPRFDSFSHRSISAYSESTLR